MSTLHRALSIVAVVSALAGCQSTPTPKDPAPFDGLTVEQEIAMRRVMRGVDEHWRLTVDASVEAVCPGARPQESASDPAETRAALRWAIRRLAACYRDGALRGEDVSIVAGPGRRSVSLARSRVVADVLMSFGVAEDRLRIVTREEAAVPSMGLCTVQVGRAHAREDRAAR